jgi:phage shock protein C
MTEKRLYRSRRSKVFGGVAGGIAEHLNVDPVIVRIIFAIAFFAGGGGFLIYIILWIAIPEAPLQDTWQMPEGSQTNPTQETSIEAPNQKSGALIAGAILIISGTLFLFHNVFHWFSLQNFWPVVLIAIGVFILISGSGRKINK